jgi:hypothetical protein
MKHHSGGWVHFRLIGVTRKLRRLLSRFIGSSTFCKHSVIKFSCCIISFKIFLQQHGSEIHVYIAQINVSRVGPLFEKDLILLLGYADQKFMFQTFLGFEQTSKTTTQKWQKICNFPCQNLNCGSTSPQASILPTFPCWLSKLLKFLMRSAGKKKCMVKIRVNTVQRCFKDTL